jgi:hypothetical protein
MGSLLFALPQLRCFAIDCLAVIPPRCVIQHELPQFPQIIEAAYF